MICTYSCPCRKHRVHTEYMMIQDPKQGNTSSLLYSGINARCVLWSTPYVLEPHSPLVDPQSLLPIVWGLSRLSMEYVRTLRSAMCLCLFACHDAASSRGDCQQAEGIVSTQTDWLIVYWVEHVRSTEYSTEDTDPAGGKRVQAAHLSYWLSRRNARINSWSILWFVAVNCVMDWVPWTVSGNITILHSITSAEYAVSE